MASSPHRMGGTSVDASCLGVRFGDGTYQTTAAKTIQTFRVPFTPSVNDSNNYYSNVPITFPTPFADANYSVSVTVDIGTLAPWAANTAYALGANIVDSNGMLQQATTAGTSGATVPTWSTGPAYNGLTTDGTVTWTIYTVTDWIYVSAVKQKTATGFICELGAYGVIPIILEMIAIHD